VWVKKLKNQLNWKNRKKNNQKNRTVKKPIKILKKPASSVRFRFYKQKTEKTEPNPNRKKTRKKIKPNRKNRAKPKNLAKTGKNQAKTEANRKTKPNRFLPKKSDLTETGRFDPVSVFLKKNSVWLLFFYKNQTEPKMITPTYFILMYELV
jgi:hypothetical protein